MKLVYFVLIYFTTNEVAGLNYKTKPGYGFGDQDYGFVDVRLGTHIFWWIQFAMNKSVEEAATIIWLPGGPGASSAGLGNIGSVGPTTQTGSYRPGNWAEKYNLLFIDSPVGSGFSHVDHEDYYCRSDSVIVADLYKTIEFVLNEHPELKNTAFYLFCNSYGAKTSLELGTRLYKNNNSKKIVFDLKGISLGNGVIGLKENSLRFNIQNYIWGAIDKQIKNELIRLRNIAVKCYDDGLISKIAEKDRYMFEYLQNSTNGFPSLILYKKRNRPSEKHLIEADDDISKHFNYFDIDPNVLHEIMNGPVKRALNIPENVVSGKTTDLVRPLVRDLAVAKYGFLEYLLQNTDIKIYMNVGSADAELPPSSIIELLSLLDWPGKDKFMKMKREMIWINGTLQGYKKITQQFGFYWLIQTGHMAFYDNPLGTMDMLISMIGY